MRCRCSAFADIASADGQCVTFAVGNDRWCNWMKLVRTVDHGQHNLRVFIREQKVFFVAVKVILPGEELTLALPQTDRKEIIDEHVNYVAVPMDCVSIADVMDNGRTIKREHDANERPVEITLSVPASCFSPAVQPVVQYDPLDLLPQSQPQLLEQNQQPASAPQSSLPVEPIASQLQQLLAAPEPTLRTFQREDSPEYPFSSNFPPFPPTVIMAQTTALPTTVSCEEKAAGVASQSRVYFLRSRKVQRASLAYKAVDTSDCEASDEDFKLSAADSSSSSGSDCCSELETDSTETEEHHAKGRRLRIHTTNETNGGAGKRGRKRRTDGATPKMIRIKRFSALRSMKTQKTTFSASFREAREQQLKAVIAANPFQYSAGEQRLQAYSTAAAMLPADVVSHKKLPIDGRMLQMITESRLRQFTEAESSDRIVKMSAEYVALMKQLVELRGGLRNDERIRKLKVVVKANPYQYSSASERRAAWRAAWQSYLDEEDCSQEAGKSHSDHFSKYVQNHLDDYPKLLDSYDDASADDNQREYMQLMREIAKMAGKNCGDDLDGVTKQKPVNAAGAKKKTTPLIRPHPTKKGYQHDRFFPSYTYRFVCWECSLHFQDENLLKLHKLQHTDSASETAGSRDCPVCDESFSKLPNLFRHILDHGVPAAQITHFIATADPSIMCFAGPTAAPMDVLPQSHDTHDVCFMYSCGVKYCGLRFCTETLCDLHQLGHNVPDDYQGDVVCVACNFRAENARELLKHVGRHGAKLNDRKLCRVGGEFMEHMVEHVQNMHKDQYLKYEACLTLSCDQCEKRFRTPEHIATHKSMTHNRKGARCLVCGTPFASYHGLVVHIKKEHKAGSDFTCFTCQKSYRTYTQLSNHARSHGQILICDVCGAVCPNRKRLAYHQLTHQADYSFKCDLCGKTFKRHCNLNQHKVVVHTDKVRKKRKAQREEMRRKGVVSEYKCPRRRMLYEEFPYKCEECRLGWMLLGNLQQHQRKKHSHSDATVQRSTTQYCSCSS
ncbi:uncharacterized protein LOC129585568 [Paramacrobiotus metropolitanus]|uniref:uncharacterized protein LOC129585568 n=1 Tax=Paramacrobiotus metropolitanus TaxID=2943436 RepID=UPI0024464CA0|nr:uncharacterized protein LOC129585568 [Paramacrobiotus metropolitanus]XP_055334262.1 uncharacterized protein LOC129585568 [Paramacrobiotus metropolitanus]XP_055334263.1 uncharacterized protein LOC129585568 [Paramacrobiotus metropolitanus]XP_055334264.1 uncharacterized protein LOC129585568 [Paramacrobiotus metropolitanus]